MHRLLFLIRNKIKQHKPLSHIFLFVACSHIFTFTYLFFFSTFKPVVVKQKRLTVKTIESKPMLSAREKQTAKINSVASSSNMSAIKSSQKKNPSSPVSKKEEKISQEAAVKKKTTLSAKSQPKSSPAKPSTTTKNSSFKNEQLHLSKQILEELESTITKIDQIHKKESPPKKITLPDAVNTLHVEESQFENLSSIQEFSTEDFTENLIYFLHEHLHLPDYGEVKMEITINANGSVETLKVLMSQSSQNKKYLEEQIPCLQFPFNQEKNSSKKKQTFVLTFCNEL